LIKIIKFSLLSIVQALTKFLKCVNWNQTQEVKQALELLSAWNPMDVEDALELLTPTFSHPVVRKYAVNRLRQADDEVGGEFSLI
jgi:phosphatidylinositol 3-kinase